MTSRLLSFFCLFLSLRSGYAAALPEIKEFTLVPARVVAPDAKHPQPRLLMIGRYARAEWKLQAGDTPIPRDPKGYFHVIAPVTDDSVKLRFVATSPNGKKEATVGDYFIPSWQKFKPPPDIAPEFLAEEQAALEALQEKPSEPDTSETPKRLRTALGIGYATFGYSQTGFAEVSTSALSGSAGLHYLAWPQTEFFLESSVFLLPFSSQPAGSHPRYVGGDFGAAEMWDLAERWGLRERLSYHFENLLIPDTLNGYHNVNGPRLHSTGSFHWGNTNALLLSLELGLNRSNNSAGFLRNLSWQLGLEYAWDVWGIEVAYRHMHLEFSEGQIDVHGTLLNAHLSF